MSRFLLRPVFHQFGKNWKNQLNFKDAVVHGWGRLILKKTEERKPLLELSTLINLTIASRSSTFIGGNRVIMTHMLLAWTDDFLIVMRRDLSQWVFTTSAAITLCRLNETCKGLEVFW